MLRLASFNALQNCGWIVEMMDNTLGLSLAAVNLTMSLICVKNSDG